MRYLYVIIIGSIFLFLTCGNKNKVGDGTDIRKCTSPEDTCVIETIISGDTLHTNSLEIKKGGKFRIINHSANLLFYLIENPDTLLAKGHKYDTVVLNGIKYVYIAVSGNGGKSDKLEISADAPDGVYIIHLNGFCPPWVLFASPQIIVRN